MRILIHRNAQPNPQIIITDVSEHFRILTILYKHARNQPKQYSTIRSYKPPNIARFNNLLSKADFSNITSPNCANTTYDLFLETINLSYEQSFPTRTITRGRNQLKGEPWITQGIFRSAKTKAKLYRRNLNTPTTDNIFKYKLFYKMFPRIKRQANFQCYRDYLKLIKKNIKNHCHFLSLLSPIFGCKIVSMPTELISDKVVKTHPDEIANVFNTFIANIGHITGESVPHHQKNFSRSQSGFPMSKDFLYGTFSPIRTHKYTQPSQSQN